MRFYLSRRLYVPSAAGWSSGPMRLRNIGMLGFLFSLSHSHGLDLYPDVRQFDKLQFGGRGAGVPHVEDRNPDALSRSITSVP
jgi:hypothetical protein